MELSRQSRFPVKASEARSSFFWVRMQSNAPPNPIRIPVIFIFVIVSLKKMTERMNTQIGCKLEKMELDTGVVLLNPSK